MWIANAAIKQDLLEHWNFAIFCDNQNCAVKGWVGSCLEFELNLGSGTFGSLTMCQIDRVKKSGLVSNAVLLFCRSKKYERDLLTMRWKISFEDIMLANRLKSTSNKVRSLCICSLNGNLSLSVTNWTQEFLL